MSSNSPSTGELVRTWRLRRRMTQLELSGTAGISSRHISFIETGRSIPSRALLLKLGGLLDVPLRERNTLLVSAGYAPVYRERALDDAAMAAAREVVEHLLAAHAPFPALAIDRHWNLLHANAAAQALLTGVPVSLLEPHANVLRISLHPEGLAPRIENLAEWRAHILERLRHQLGVTCDPKLAELLSELEAFPIEGGPEIRSTSTLGGIVVPLKLRLDENHVLSFLSTTTIFGTPRDISLEEMAIETFFPADAATTALLHRGAGA